MTSEAIPESWDLITAGNGRTRFPMNRGPERRWYALDAPWKLGITDAEVLALGPVRRAVVVTLPDKLPGPVTSLSSGGFQFLGFVRTVESTRMLAAALLAAALHAEEGR